MLLNSKDLDECYDYDNNDKSFKKLYECLNLNKTFQRSANATTILNDNSAEELSAVSSPFKVNCKLEKPEFILEMDTSTTKDRTQEISNEAIFFTNINEQSHNELGAKSHRLFKKVESKPLKITPTNVGDIMMRKIN